MDTKPPIPLAILVGIQTPEVDDVAHAASLEELDRLVKTLGYEIMGTVSQRREGTGAGSLLGSGKLAELAALTGGSGVVGTIAPPPKSKARQRLERAAEAPAELNPDAEAIRKPEFVIVDHEFSPSQIRNLERATGAQVLDRTGVIVEIFHRHANTREAKLQVEMARLKYVAPRLRESSGGGGRQQGPGAGETSLDLDRRKIRDRIGAARDQLPRGPAGGRVTPAKFAVRHGACNRRGSGWLRVRRALSETLAGGASPSPTGGRLAPPNRPCCHRLVRTVPEVRR